jgi:hypothetical protein
MNRPLRLVACLALALIQTACTLPEGQSPGEATAAAQAILDRLEAERAAIAEQVSVVDARLAEIQAAAQETSSGELATIAVNLRAKVDEGRELLDRLDRGIETAKSSLAAAPVYTDTASQHLSNAGAIAQGVGAVLPPPFGEIAGLVGILLGGAAAARARSKARLATESVSDALAGFDRWFDSQAASSVADAARAREAWSSIQGAMSAKTKQFVRTHASYPVE